MAKGAEGKLATQARAQAGKSVQAVGQTDSTVQALGQIDIPAPIKAYLQATLGQVAQVGDDPTSLWAIGERSLQMETAGKILAGKAFIALRESLPPREFSAGLAERNIARSSAYHAIDAWQMFSGLDDLSSVQALAQIGVTKALALRHMTPDEHRALADGEIVRGLSIDQLAEMSSREVQQQQREWQLAHDDAIQKLEREKAQLKNQLDIVTNQKNQLARAGQALQAEEDMPLFALTVRQEFLAQTEAMTFALDNLQLIAGENLFTELKHPEAPRWQPVAASTAFFALAGLQARVQQLMTAIAETYPDNVSMVTNEAQLTAAELKRYAEQRDQLIGMAKAAAKKRDDDRQNNVPGKRGAKRK